MTLTNLIEALQIIKRNTPENYINCVRAEHDELYIGDEDWINNKEDLDRLEELGWNISEGSFHSFV